MDEEVRKERKKERQHIVSKKKGWLSLTVTYACMHACMFAAIPGQALQGLDLQVLEVHAAAAAVFLAPLSRGDPEKLNVTSNCRKYKKIKENP